MTTAKTTVAYHGTIDDAKTEPRWFTTDRAHAACFGPVREYRITYDSALEVDADKVPALAAGGWEADEALYAMLAESGKDVALIKGWEGKGLCVVTTRWATVETVS